MTKYPINSSFSVIILFESGLLIINKLIIDLLTVSFNALSACSCVKPIEMIDAKALESGVKVCKEKIEKLL